MPAPHRRHHRVRRVVGTALAGLLAAGVATATLRDSTGASPSTPAAATALAGRLDTILADPRYTGSQVGLTVRDADTGDTLYDRDGATRLLPASNAKLLTSAAALDALGPSFRFRTSVLRTAAARGGRLAGDLYLKGYGDPTSTVNDYDALAAAVAKAGIRHVDGGLVADDTYFDDARLAPFWSWDDEPYYYDAQTSALNIAPDTIGDTGTVLVTVTPGRTVGAAPRVSMTPANGYVTLHVTATTGAAGSAQTVDAEREHGKNVIDVTGSIPLGGTAFVSQPTVDQPTGLAADVFTRALARHGVTLGRSGVRTAATPADATAVATRSSAPLSQVLTPFLKLSNNMIAEALTKAMGVATAHAGTWAAGTAAILDDVATFGVHTDALQLYDGSGLGRADYLTADAITTLLDGARHKPWFATWYAALPIAGEPGDLVGGTLQHRMAGTAAAGNVHAKTGSETGVSALSGYVTDAAGEHLEFSMISNNFVAGGISTLEDAVAETLAANGGAAAARVPAPVPATTSRTGQLECSWTRSC